MVTVSPVLLSILIHRTPLVALGWLSTIVVSACMILKSLTRNAGFAVLRDGGGGCGMKDSLSHEFRYLVPAWLANALLPWRTQGRPRREPPRVLRPAAHQRVPKQFPFLPPN